MPGRHTFISYSFRTESKKHAILPREPLIHTSVPNFFLKEGCLIYLNQRKLPHESTEAYLNNFHKYHYITKIFIFHHGIPVCSTVQSVVQSSLQYSLVYSLVQFSLIPVCSTVCISEDWLVFHSIWFYSCNHFPPLPSGKRIGQKNHFLHQGNVEKSSNPHLTLLSYGTTYLP